MTAYTRLYTTGSINSMRKMKLGDKFMLKEMKPVKNYTDVDIAKIKSAVLARIVAEVRNNEPSTIRAFDRIHNRHNRS